MKGLATIAFIFVIVSGSFTQVNAQRNKGFDYDKFKAEKIAFITEAIDLTPAEAQHFWPVYNEYEKKKWELIQSRHDLERKLREGLEEMSEAEYKKLSVKLAAFPIEDGQLNTEYNNKFLEILSAKKVVQLYIAEIDFRGKMLRNYRDRDGNNRKKD